MKGTVVTKVAWLLSQSAHGLTATEIGCDLGYARTSAAGAVCSALKRLVAMGAVTRSERDGRIEYTRTRRPAPAPSLQREKLLAARVPHAEVLVGRAYRIHARNGRVGVALRDDAGRLVYRLRREKFGHVYLFDEIDWEDDERHGTAIPLELLDAAPPLDDTLLTWLDAYERLLDE